MSEHEAVCYWYRVGSRYAESFEHGIRWHLGDMVDWKACPYCGKELVLTDHRNTA